MPPTSLRIGQALIWAAAVVLATCPARAQEPPADDAVKQRCKQAYEAAQEHRLAKRLIEARHELRACVVDACPAFVRKDCGTWLDEVEAAIPTFEAHRFSCHSPCFLDLDAFTHVLSSRVTNCSFQAPSRR